MGIFMKKRSTIMWCLLAEMQTVFQDMPIAGELVKQNTGEMWLDLINLADSVTEGRIISCLCLKQPLICFLLSNYFPKTGKSGAT